MLYKRTYISGGGTEEDDGIVDITFTKNTTTIRQDNPPPFPIWIWQTKELKMKGIPDIDKDGTFVIYHRSAGIPFIYTPCEQSTH